MDGDHLAEPVEAVAAPIEKAPARQGPTLALLRNTNFRTLWLAQSVSWTGDHFTFLALMIVLNQLTGSASAIALLMIVFTLPRLVFGILAGVFVDRWNRQRLMVITDAVRGLLSLGFILVASRERVWLIYPLAFVVSSLGVFFMPARSAIMKTILPQEDLLQGNILMQTTFTLTLVIGPALAGITIGLWGTTAAFSFDAVTFLVSAALVATMVVPHLIGSGGDRPAADAFWGDLREGLGFVKGSRAVTGVLVVLTVVSLATGAVNALFAPFLMNVLHVGASELGIADSAQGLGMIIGGMLAAAVAARLRMNVLISAGILVAGLAIIIIGLAPNYLTVLVTLAFLGLILTPLQAGLSALMQKIVPLEKMGRVSGAFNTSQSVATLISMGAAGVLADVVGARLVFVASGVVAVASALVAISAIRDE